jgi:hypothetical protein
MKPEEDTWGLSVGQYVVDLCPSCKWDLAQWLGKAFLHPSLDAFRKLFPSRGFRRRPTG